MNVGFCLRRFDGQSRLLVRCLLSGTGGARLALKVFHRQQRTNTDVLLSKLLETLCQEEVTSANTEPLPLITKPLVSLFPTLFKQNLLSFIHLVSPSVPQASVLQLLQCLSQESIQSPWVSVLSRQLKRNLGCHTEEGLYTSECSQRLKNLTQRLVDQAETSGWAQCLNGHAVDPVPQHASISTVQGTQKKRKMSFVTQDSNGEESGQPSKRVKVNKSEEDIAAAAGLSGQDATSGGSGEVPSADAILENQEAKPNSLCNDLPGHMKVSVLQIKDLLESPTEWDQSSMDVFKVFHECDPGQMELLCSILHLSDLPEQSLPRLCSGILASTSDLSYSTATTLLKSLLLKKVQSLSAPASRCLVTAVTSLSSRYPRPVCSALIGPVLENKDIGIPQTELLNKLIEGCLDSHYRLLVLQMSFKISWSEELLSIIHSLLDSKPDISEELFTQLTKQLVSQGPLFTKSVKFAKMLLTILSKYGSCVTPSHKQSLDGVLMLHGTFLKKSLQAALKRITPT